MLEKPTKKKVDRQEQNMPSNIEQLIQYYDLENLKGYICNTIDYINNAGIYGYDGNMAIGGEYTIGSGNRLQVYGSIDIPSSSVNNDGYKVNGNVVLRQNNGGNTVLAGNGSTMYFRPNGTYSDTGQASLSNTGVLTATKFVGAFDGTATNANYLITPSAAGYTTDQYGNFQHNRSTNTDKWMIKNNEGTTTVSFNWESGEISTSDVVKSKGLVASAYPSNGAQLRLYREASANGCAFLIRNDGSDTYFMLTDAGQQESGSYNSLRPIRIEHSTGKVTIGNGLSVSNGISGTLTGNVTGDVTGNVSGSSGSCTGNAASATYSTNVHTTPTDPSSSTTYYGTFINGNAADTNYVVRTNDGFRYETKQGTTSANGNSVLRLGNGTDDGTAGNKRGYLRLYSKKTGYAQITPADATSDTTHYLPTTGGYLLNTGTTSITQTVTSGTELATLKINGTDTKLYCPQTSPKADQSKLSLTNPTSGTWYYPTWTSGIENNGYYTLRGNDGLRYYTLQGTTSATGRTILQIGNGTASGTAGNKYGQLRLYGVNTGSATLQYRDTTTSCTLTLPAHDGNMIERNNLYSNTSGTTGNVTLSETAANFDALEITYKDSTNSRYGYTKVYNPDGKGFNLQYAEFGSSTGAAVLFGRSYSISGTTITASSNYGYMGLADSAATHTNRFQIVRVDGIKG